MIYWSFIKKKNSVALNNLIKWVGELYNIFTFDLFTALLYKLKRRYYYFVVCVYQVSALFNINCTLVYEKF
jgi:hypothetical protein